MNNLNDFVHQARKNKQAVQEALNDNLEPLLTYFKDQFPETVLTRQEVEQIASSAFGTRPYTPPAKKSKRGSPKIIYLVPVDAVYKPEQLLASLNLYAISEIRIATPMEVKPQHYRQIVQGRKEEVVSRGARRLLRPVPKCKKPECWWFAMTEKNISDIGLCLFHRAALYSRQSLKKRLNDLNKLEDELHHCMNDENRWKWWYVLHSDLVNMDVNMALDLSDFIQTLLVDPPDRTIERLITNMRIGALTELKGVGPERLQQVREALEKWIWSRDVPPLTPDLLGQILIKFKVDWVKIQF